MGTETLDAAAIEVIVARIYAVLHQVYDPELGVNVVDRGLVYGVDLRPDGFITIRMTLTSPGCPMHESLGVGVGQADSGISGVTGGEIELVWDPPWEPSMMTDRGRSELGWLVAGLKLRTYPGVPTGQATGVAERHPASRQNTPVARWKVRIYRGLGALDTGEVRV